MSMSKTLNGKIIKGIGGFYYVEAANQVYECKARGVFRKEKTTPLCGDVVTISVNDGAENTIDEIHPRKNQLMRPPVVRQPYSDPRLLRDTVQTSQSNSLRRQVLKLKLPKPTATSRRAR